MRFYLVSCRLVFPFFNHTIISPLCQYLYCRVGNKPVGTPTQVFNKNNIRSSLEQKIEEQKNSSNISLEWSTLTRYERVTIYENIEGRYAAYPDGCNLSVYPQQYLFGNQNNLLDYDSSLGEVVWVDTIYQDFRTPYPLTVERCENNGKSCILSIKNTGNIAAYVTKLHILGDAYIKVEGQRTRSPGSGEEKVYELKYNHDYSVIDQLAKDIAEYNLYSNLKISLQSEDDYSVGSFVVITEDYMGTIIGRITKKTTVLRDFFMYDIESITDYNPVEDPEILMKPSGKMAALLAIPPDITAPTAPTITNASTLANGKIQVTFTGSTDNESGVYLYNIYRCLAETETGTKDTPVVIYTIPHDGSANYTFVDQNTENSKWYFYTITAVDKANNESGKSDEGSVQSVVSEAPQSPYLIKAEAISDGVSITMFLYGDTSIFENTITSSTFFRLQVSMNNGITWSDVGRFQGNTYLWRWPDTFTINPSTVNILKFRAFSWNMYNIESAIPIEMMNHKVKFDPALFPPPYLPAEDLFTLVVVLQSLPGTQIVTLAKGWYKIIIKAAGGGGSGGGGSGGFNMGYISIPFASWALGDDGDSGGSGKDGTDGGDSLIIIANSNTTITTKGGIGGKGGRGGSGGTKDINSRPPPMRKGDDGKSGTDGQDGGYIEKIIFVAERTEVTIVTGAPGKGGSKGNYGHAGN
jgi:hypothetical protein